MTDSNDNPLAGIDLSAWQPPAPGDGLADAVVTRMHATPSVSALESTEHERERGRKRRWWLVGGILAAVAVAAVLGVRGFVRAPRDGHGTVAAVQPSHLDLGASSAELETGAEVTWRREGHRVAVTQARGIAIWRIGDDDLLVLDAGAAVASVEATGASLRVEVKMNLSDARVLGASAATAAVVSLVTVVVYEGHVKVNGSGQTVNVAPGNTVAVAPNAPPRAVDDQSAVAGGLPAPTPLDDEASLQKRASACGKDTSGSLDISIQIAANGTARIAKLALGPDTDPAVENCVNAAVASARFDKKLDGTTFSFHLDWIRPCDVTAMLQEGTQFLQQGLDARALQSFEAARKCGGTSGQLYTQAFIAACRARSESKAKEYYALLPEDRRETMSQICVRNGITFDTKATVAKQQALYSDAVGRVIGNLEPGIRSCGNGKYTGTITAHVRVEPSGVVSNATAEPASEVTDCLVDILKDARFPVTQRGGNFSYPFEFNRCDGNKLKTEGETLLQQGMDAAAIVRFEEAMKCGAKGDTATKAFMAACRSRNEPKARQYYPMLPADRRDAIAQICVRNGITF